LAKFEFTVRPINKNEIDKVAGLISAGYYNDDFFKWSVDSDDHRHKIVADYYKIYLGAAGCVAHVAESPNGIIGATVWLPHDVDASIYDNIDRAAGIYAPQFRAVADRSHDSEPPIGPFYQLVGFVVAAEARGMGIGGAMLKYHLDILDTLGIPTYLEASTPYFGGGVYGRFGYQQVGELMVFADTAVLYPLWRPAKTPNPVVRFGEYDWRVLETRGTKALLLSDKVLCLQKYHDTFEGVTWEKSDLRQYLNSAFYDTFTPLEQSQIIETKVCGHSNPWFVTDNGPDTMDKIFILSVEEVAKYFGDSGQLKVPGNKFFINDIYNDARRAVYADDSPCRWMLRTPGNFPYLVATVTTGGKIAVTGDFVNRQSTELFNVGVRPAMWVER